MSIYRRALGYYRPFLRQTLIATAVTVALIPFNLLKVWPIAFVVGEVLPAALGGRPPLLEIKGLFRYDFAGWNTPLIVGAACAAMVVLHLLCGWLNLIATMLYLRVGLHGLLKLRTDLYACLHSLPLKFHDARRSADSSFRVAYDSQALQTFYAKATFIFQTAITVISTLAVMAWLDWQLTALSLVVVPLMIVTFRLFAWRIREEATVIAERESAVLTQAQEGLSSVKMVQAFGREEHEVDVFRSSASRSLEANIRLQNTAMRSALIVSSLLAASTAAMYWIGSGHVLDGSLKLNALIAINGYLLMLYAPLESLTQVGWDLEKAAAGARRCFEVLDHHDDVADSPNAKPLQECRGEIAFEHVRFGYTPEREILRDVHLRIAPGQTVAFVGGTGAGKSTLLSLVPRFYDPSAGRVLVDGHDLRDLTKKSLRGHISIVLQDTLLFSTTIRENIAYGRPSATEAEIVEAAKQAQAHEFIIATKDSYRSQVGERGGHLSVGQRQRIGIARAFLKNAPILILDEPTSALDPTTEAAIMATLEELMRGRTTLVITHRIATIHSMEKIVVLGNGGVLEEGNGSELLTKNGAYATLYRAAHLGG